MNKLDWTKSNLLTIASRILAGEVVIMPTDTIYGSLGTALDTSVVSRIYELKDRTPSKPVIILISSLKDLKLFKVTTSSSQAKYLKKFWPGPISVILPCKNPRYEYLHRGTKTLAFRLPKDELLLELLKSTGPLIAPSANLEGYPPAKTVKEANEYFHDKVDLYIDGGEKVAPPSTLVYLIGNQVSVLRGSLA